MSERLEMLEETLNLMEEGVVILDEHAIVSFWNDAAESLTGHTAMDMLSQPWPEYLCRVEPGECAHGPQDSMDGERVNEAQPRLVSMRHKLGHSLPVMLRRVELRKPFGEAGGTVLLFFPVEETDALPHGDTAEGRCIERSQADMEDWLDAAHHRWITNRVPFGLLWITIDQSQSLRKTHGRDACEEMLRTVEQTLLRQMKPAEIIGRWGSNEFLVLTHERTAELLLERARRLLGLARTAEFRWWGDRVGITVSIGVRQATEGDTLQSMLNDARRAMQASEYAGGNHVTDGRAR